MVSIDQKKYINHYKPSRTVYERVFAEILHKKLRDDVILVGATGDEIKQEENRVAQNNEILNNRAQCERIPHYNGENVSYTKIQPPWFRITGVPVVQLPCVLR
ncbi:hypothetical protein T08_2434 [Trichinella sp. T8]|nr:hypothetical protein T08_2434 [Trichinella sp. T8]